MSDESSSPPAGTDQPGRDSLRERVAALNEKAGDLAETLKRIGDKLSEAMSADSESPQS